MSYVIHSKFRSRANMFPLRIHRSDFWYTKFYSFADFPSEVNLNKKTWLSEVKERNKAYFIFIYCIEIEIFF